MQSLNINNVVAFLIVALAVFGMLVLLKPPIQWVWRTIRARSQTGLEFDSPSEIDKSNQRLELVVIPQSTAGGYLSFTLYNQSLEDIRKCYAELIKVTKESDPYYSIPERYILTWSSRNPPGEGKKDLIAGEHLVVDVVANYNPTTNLMSYVVQNVPPPPASKGDYSASIVIYGICNKRSFTCSFDLEFTYNGGRSFVCKNNGQEIILDKPKWRI